MIIEYHQPDTMDDAIKLLSRKTPKSLPLGGGTVLSQRVPESIAVVDLALLGLNFIRAKDESLFLGGNTPLETIQESPVIPDAIKKVINFEGTSHLRSKATIAGTIVCADGKSPLMAVLHAMDASLVWLPENIHISLGKWLARKLHPEPGLILSQIILPNNVQCEVETVGRTPTDTPLMTVAGCKWLGGRVRLALGGYGDCPLLVCDGPIDKEVNQAAALAYDKADDLWASAEYRSAMASLLTDRVISRFS